MRYYLIYPLGHQHSWKEFEATSQDDAIREGEKIAIANNCHVTVLQPIALIHPEIIAKTQVEQLTQKA